MKRGFTKIAALVMATALGLSVFGGCGAATDMSGYVALDINPSIEFIVNKDGKVSEVRAVNEDAKILISDMNLVGLKIEVAVELVTDEAEIVGYINANNTDVSITVGGNTAEVEKKLRDVAEKGVRKACEYAEIVSDQVKQALESAVNDLKAENARVYADLTAAKLKIINSIMKFDRNFTVERGAQMSMHRLIDVLEEHMDDLEDFYDDKLEAEFEKRFNAALEAAKDNLNPLLDQIYGEGYAAQAALMRKLELIEESLERELEIKLSGEVRFDFDRDFDDAEDTTPIAEISADLRAELEGIIGTDINVVVTLDDLDDYIDAIEEDLEQAIDLAKDNMHAISKIVIETVEEIIELARTTAREGMREMVAQLKADYAQQKAALLNPQPAQ